MQMIIMFLITACTTLCVLSSSFLVTRVLVDDHHRIRLDRIAKGPLWPTILYQAVKKLAGQAMGRIAAAWQARRSAGYARLNVQE
jgi:hypothetical protein